MFVCVCVCTLLHLCVVFDDYVCVVCVCMCAHAHVLYMSVLCCTVVFLWFCEFLYVCISGGGGRCLHVHFDVLSFAACYCVFRRKVRYQGTPRNIYRHFIISDIKDATATLPPVSPITQHLHY